MGDQQQHTWRDNPEEKAVPCKHWTALDLKKRRFLNSVRTKYPKKCVTMKAAMLDDLLSKFVAKKNKAPRDDSPKEHIKERLNCVQRPDIKPSYYKKLQNAAVLLKDENKISELVTQIESSKFKITTEQNASTINCYENTPCEASVGISSGNILESRPDVKEKIENVSIYCDSYHMNNTTNIPTASQLSIIGPQSINQLM